MIEEKDTISDKDVDIIKQILALEKMNNKVQRFTNQEMINKIIDIVKKGAEDED